MSAGATPASSVFTPAGSSASGELSLSSSFIEKPPTTPSHDSALSSLSSRSDDASSYVTDDDAEAEWQESLQQMELLLSLVIVPFVGKWIGRRCAYWAWSKFMAWKYAVDIVITSSTQFNIAGAVAAASPPPSLPL